MKGVDVSKITDKTFTDDKPKKSSGRDIFDNQTEKKEVSKARKDA